MCELKVSASDISREDVLTAIDGDGRFFVVVSKMRRLKQNPNLDGRVIDRALQRERKAGVIASVKRRWVRVVAQAPELPREQCGLGYMQGRGAA